MILEYKQKRSEAMTKIGRYGNTLSVYCNIA